MKEKPIIPVAVAVLLVLAILVSAMFGLSLTHDFYACHACKSVGESNALRLFRVPIWKSRIRVIRSLTAKQCDHKWQWYFANSKGILFNREDWDGPVGNYPFAEDRDSSN